jgi:hypothetical protein
VDSGLGSPTLLQTAQSCRLLVSLVLQCSLPKADTGETAQHLRWPDDGFVDKSTVELNVISCIYLTTKGNFWLFPHQKSRW